MVFGLGLEIDDFVAVVDFVRAATLRKAGFGSLRNADDARRVLGLDADGLAHFESFGRCFDAYFEHVGLPTVAFHGREDLVFAIYHCLLPFYCNFPKKLYAIYLFDVDLV
jgi:hypothetical protein